MRRSLQDRIFRATIWLIGGTLLAIGAALMALPVFIFYVGSQMVEWSDL